MGDSDFIAPLTVLGDDLKVDTSEHDPDSECGARQLQSS